MIHLDLQELQELGYFNITTINGKVCGLKRFIFTVGLVYGLNDYGYEGRYCYDSLSDAKEALDNWDGKTDPIGPWIKHKGKNEYSNPNYIK